MRKNYFILLLLVAPLSIFAQDEAEKEETPDGWHKAGNISLLFNQAAFNAEWTGGGTSNYAANLTLNYDFNYKQGKLLWDNRIMADYGITKTKDQEFTRKTNDRLEFNSLLGRQINESNWYYSLFLNFKTQFTSGYEYFEDTMGNEARLETTKFMSPGYLQFGPGMLWKKNENLKVNIAPATARLIFVDDVFTTTVGYMDGDYFGVDAGESTRFEFGAAISGYAKFNAMENISIENVLNLYSNYLEDPQNIDIDYTLNVVMTVNKWISANATFQAIYDDNAVQGFQIREALGIGVTYAF
ncbi:DUF3078 domain-containing protein [Constantimarinum furrinae]|uniref:DUF3078 domain-containing protein n=1 Tax=Constantimarinum furrinae TaxID=2562285 RepID=A0A7G8PSN2_9FLAO|nr:DUF3078 domain-containing protein [Constantimarinum furrinae]QNJ97348.1 hypothetical protein ALE3EI_0772 [Constantimarinum furrinae]